MKKLNNNNIRKIPKVETLNERITPSGRFRIMGFHSPTNSPIRL